MKYSMLIFVIIGSIVKLNSQELLEQNDLKTFLYNLPINADKMSIIKAAKEKFKNNTIDSFVIETNTKIYFMDTTVEYKFFSNKPITTTLLIYDSWSYDNQKASDTNLYIVIDASFGTSDNAKRRMYSAYNHLVEIFDGKFVLQKPYKLFADQLFAEGLNFFINEEDKHATITIGWNNGGCFQKYHVSVSFKR